MCNTALWAHIGATHLHWRIYRLATCSIYWYDFGCQIMFSVHNYKHHFLDLGFLFLWSLLYLLWMCFLWTMCKRYVLLTCCLLSQYLLCISAKAKTVFVTGWKWSFIRTEMLGNFVCQFRCIYLNHSHIQPNHDVWMWTTNFPPAHPNLHTFSLIHTVHAIVTYLQFY